MAAVVGPPQELREFMLEEDLLGGSDRKAKEEFYNVLTRPVLVFEDGKCPLVETRGEEDNLGMSQLEKEGTA